MAGAFVVLDYRAFRQTGLVISFSKGQVNPKLRWAHNTSLSLSVGIDFERATT